MKYELTRDEERELNQKLERRRKVLEAMNYTLEDIEHELKRECTRFRNLIARK